MANSATDTIEMTCGKVQKKIMLKMLRWSVEILMVTLTVASDNVTAEQGILVNQLVFSWIFINFLSIRSRISTPVRVSSRWLFFSFLWYVLRFSYDFFISTLFYVNHSFTHSSSTMEILYLLHFFSHPMEFLPTSFFILCSAFGDNRASM